MIPVEKDITQARIPDDPFIKNEPVPRVPFLPPRCRMKQCPEGFSPAEASCSSRRWQTLEKKEDEFCIFTAFININATFEDLPLDLSSHQDNKIERIFTIRDIFYIGNYFY
jgi:hypothetical protein